MKPSGQGLSSSTVNALWGCVNLAVGYVLLCRVGHFDLRSTDDVIILGLGVVLMSTAMARMFALTGEDPQVRARIVEDEAKFMDRAASRIVLVT